MGKNDTVKDKLTDRAFSRLILTAVITIVTLVACLCSTTWAWFNASVTTAGNNIRASVCLIEVSLTVPSAEQEASALLVADIDTSVTENLAAGTYTVTLTIPQESASGYALIQANGIDYHTECVSNQGDPYTTTLSFSLILTEQTEITITPKWGIYAEDASVGNGGTLTISRT